VKEIFGPDCGSSHFRVTTRQVVHTYVAFLTKQYHLVLAVVLFSWEMTLMTDLTKVITGWLAEI